MTARLSSSLCTLLVAFGLALAGPPSAGTGPRGPSCCGAGAPCAEGGAADCSSLAAAPCCDAGPLAVATRGTDAKPPAAPAPTADFAAAFAAPATAVPALPEAPAPTRPLLRSVVLQL